MKTFEEIYNELQEADNNELNELWKEAKNESEKARNIILTICLIINALIGIAVLRNRIQHFSILFFIIPFIFIINMFVVIIVKMFFSKKKKQYNIEYKKVVINKIMNNFYDKLKYFPQMQMPTYIYKEADYNESYDIYDSEDYLEGLIANKYEIKMAEVLTQREESHTNSKGETETRTITMFHGLFAKIYMDKSINSELTIVKNAGMLFQKNRLKMDSREFEKYFDVKASNKIIGMQLLTADVMEELIEFKNKTNIEFDININNNKLYLRFHCGAMFEAGNIKNGAIDKTVMKKYFDILNFTYNLSKEIIDLVNETQI